MERAATRAPCPVASEVSGEVVGCVGDGANTSISRLARTHASQPATQVGAFTSTYQPRTLLDLSTELLIEILTDLPVADLLSMQHTCRTMRNIIGGTVYLQYIVRTHINDVDDFLPPEFSYSERLELLRRHEQVMEYSTSQLID